MKTKSYLKEGDSYSVFIGNPWTSEAAASLENFTLD